MNKQQSLLQSLLIYGHIIGADRMVIYYSASEYVENLRGLRMHAMV